MWTSESLSQVIQSFRDRQAAKAAADNRRNKANKAFGPKVHAEHMEARVLMSISQAVDAGLPNLAGAVSVTKSAQPTPMSTAQPTAVKPAAAPAELTAVTPAAVAAGRPVVFVDAAVARTATLPADADVVTIDPHGDALRQMTAELAKRTNVPAVHIVSHGSQARVRLSGRDVTRKDLYAHAKDLKKWAASLAADATIDVYGCDVAGGTAGQKFVDALADLTNATVAASTDATGPAAIGGDSTLEYVAAPKTGTATPAVAAPAPNSGNIAPENRHVLHT